MDGTEFIFLLIIAAIVYGICRFASKHLTRINSILKLVLDFILIPIDKLLVLLVNRISFLYSRVVPESFRTVSEEKCEKWGGFGTVIFFIITILTITITIIVAAFSKDGLSVLFQDLLLNTALFSFISIFELFSSDKLTIFTFVPMLEVGLASFLTLTCMRKCSTLHKGIQFLYSGIFAMFSSIIGYLVPNSVVQFISTIWKTIQSWDFSALSNSGSFSFTSLLQIVGAIFQLIIYLLAIYIILVIVLISLTEYLSMLRFSVILLGVVCLIAYIASLIDIQLNSIVASVIVIVLIPVASYWRMWIDDHEELIKK